MSDDAVSTGQAAKRLNVSREAVRQMCESGRLNAYRVGPSGQWRVYTAAIDAVREGTRPKRRLRT